MRRRRLEPSQAEVGLVSSCSVVRSYRRRPLGRKVPPGRGYWPKTEGTYRPSALRDGFDQELFACVPSLATLTRSIGIA